MAFTHWQLFVALENTALVFTGAEFKKRPDEELKKLTSTLKLVPLKHIWPSTAVRHQLSVMLTAFTQQLAGENESHNVNMKESGLQYAESAKDFSKRNASQQENGTLGETKSYMQGDLLVKQNAYSSQKSQNSRVCVRV